MKNKEEKNKNDLEQMSLLNRKRKNKNKKKDIKYDDNISIETSLEISKIHSYINHEEIKNKKKGDIMENENDQNINNTIKDPILLIKKTLINFNTDESKFQRGRMNPEIFPEEEKKNSYYVQRYYFFSLFDKGIQMDRESWYSVTPEEISEYISSIIPDSSDSSILDGFCGCGGNIISFSKHFKKVLANDLVESKINMTKNNSKIYECPDNIQYYNKDYFDLDFGDEQIDYIFLSPPWGGPEYKKDKIYSLKKWINPDIEKIIEKSLKISKNIIFYLPRNTDLEELANLLNEYDKEGIKSVNNTILLDVQYLNSASKIKAILVLYGPKFNSIKIKLIREFLINSVFRKNSNKINQIKVKRQINILKIIGYSEYIRNFIDLKESKKEFSGNSFLEIIEKYFIQNIMDKEQIIEFEKLCKIKNVNNDDKNENYLLGEYSEKEKEKENINQIKMDIEKEFIDLRKILSEEQFNKIKENIFF